MGTNRVRSVLTYTKNTRLILNEIEIKTLWVWFEVLRVHSTDIPICRYISNSRF